MPSLPTLSGIVDIPSAFPASASDVVKPPTSAVKAVVQLSLSCSGAWRTSPSFVFGSDESTYAKGYAISDKEKST